MMQRWQYNPSLIMQFRVSNVNDLMDCWRSNTIHSCKYNAELFCEHDCSYLCKTKKFASYILLWKFILFFLKSQETPLFLEHKVLEVFVLVLLFIVITVGIVTYTKVTLFHACFNPSVNNAPKWSDTLQISCNICCKIFKVCLAVLRHALNAWANYFLAFFLTHFFLE